MQKNSSEHIKEYINEINIKNIFFNSILIALIIFILDYLNIPSRVLNIEIKYFEKIFFVAAMYIIIFLYLFLNSCISFFISFDYNPFDDVIIYSFMIFVLNSFSNLILNHSNIMNNIIIICSIILFLVRLLIIKCRKKQESKTSLKSLSELYIGDNNVKDFILIKEEPITSLSDDLLDFTQIKNSINNYIYNCHPDKSFVLGVVGEWGSGKTSLINIVRNENKNKDIEILDFNIWNYNDEQAMFDGLYNLILKKVNSSVNVIELRKNINKYRKLIFKNVSDNTKITIDNIINDYKTDIEEIKAELNNVLSEYNKEIVIVIDDLDRVNKEQMLFATKMLSNIINLNKIKYIICYNESKVDSILNGEYEKNYLDKIINAKITIPGIDRTTFNIIVKKTLVNLLKQKEIIFDENEKEFMEITNLISSDINTPRELIQFLNSISLTINNLVVNNLYLNDYIVIEYIRVRNEKLYQLIYNYGYSVVYMAENEINNKLNMVVPETQQNLVQSYLLKRNKTSEEELNNKHRILSERYFYCYFGNKPKKYINMLEKVKIIIDKVNNKENIDDDIEDIIKSSAERDEYIKIIKGNLNKINNPIYFLQKITPYYKELIGIIIEVLRNCSNSQIKNYIESNNSNIMLLNEIKNNIDNSTTLKVDITIIKHAEKELKKAIEKIISNNNDIFEDRYYQKDILKTIISIIYEEDTKKYINKIINSNNILRFILECLEINQGYKITSTFSNSRAQSYIDHNNFINIYNQIDQRKLNDLEKKVYNSYNKSIEFKINEINNLSKIRYKDFKKNKKKK